MDHGNLSKLAAKWGVRLSDRAGLLALAAEHRRPSAAAIASADDQFHESAVKLARNVPKLLDQAEQGREFVIALLRECGALRAGIIALTKVLAPIWQVVQSENSLTLSGDELARINAALGPDVPSTLALLERQQEADSAILAESKSKGAK